MILLLAEYGRRNVMSELLYINLTNGLEYLEDVPELQNTTTRFTRIQSTALEQGHMTEVIDDLDNDLLMNLAMGNRCLILDKASRSGKVSRALWFGVPWIKYVLERKWFGKVPDKCFLINGINVAKYFSDCYRKLPVRISRKIKYFKTYTNPNIGCVFLDYQSLSTTHDGDKEYYRKIVQNFVLKDFKKSIKVIPENG